MESKAYLKQVRLTPRKAQLVADLIRGKGINEALADLRFLPRRNAALIFSKLISSAAANANDKGQVDLDSLYVKSVIVNKGPTMKRWRPRAKGSAFKIEKKTSHVSVVLGDR